MDRMSEKVVIVVGAGAAGLLAAGAAAEQGAEVILLERNNRPAKKVLITGKGRCNVTNHCDDLQEMIRAVPSNGRFLYSAFSRFMPADTMRLFTTLGVPLKTERGQRVFPQSDQAADIAEALIRYARRNDVKMIHGRVSSLLLDEGRALGVKTYEGASFYADSVILATGGLSYPKTGSTGDGYALSESAGHTIVTPHPSLVALDIHEGWCYDLQGLSLRNSEIRVEDTVQKREVYRDFGEMLFTHFGVSGPMILSASAHMQQMESGRYQLHLDLKPALTVEQLDKRILRDFEESQNRNFINALDKLLPKKLVPVIVRLSGIAASTKVHDITRQQRRALAELLKDICLTVKGYRPIEEAVVTSGGVSTAEINPRTMESKLCSGLYFAGELIDVDAYTGGYNLQIAFSTGHLAGSCAGKDGINDSDCD